MADSAGPVSIERRPDGSARGRFRDCELMSAFQPIWAFPTADAPHEPVTAVAYEGLLRISGAGADVPPEAFFAGLGADMRAGVEAAARTLHLINAGACLPQGALVFVNFDPSLLTGAASAERMLRDMRLAMRGSGLQPARVVCEITEQPAGSEAALLALVDGLRGRGHRIAADDYGAAASDAVRVELISPDFIKFDARWVRQRMATPAGFAMLAGMVERFAARGIVSVFEGMEEGWQIALAERSGAAMVQGYGLARPALASARPRASDDRSD